MTRARAPPPPPPPAHAGWAQARCWRRRSWHPRCCCWRGWCPVLRLQAPARARTMRSRWSGEERDTAVGRSSSSRTSARHASVRADTLTPLLACPCTHPCSSPSTSGGTKYQYVASAAESANALCKWVAAGSELLLSGLCACTRVPRPPPPPRHQWPIRCRRLGFAQAGRVDRRLVAELWASAFSTKGASAGGWGGGARARGEKPRCLPACLIGAPSKRFR